MSHSVDKAGLLDLALHIARQAGDLLVNRPASWDLTVKSTAIDIATQMMESSVKKEPPVPARAALPGLSIQ